jgi:hypothetical protein
MGWLKRREPTRSSVTDKPGSVTYMANSSLRFEICQWCCCAVSQTDMTKHMHVMHPDYFTGTEAERWWAQMDS